MTPTPSQAQAELERRKENQKRKAAGEPKITTDNIELVQATKAELKAWAEGK